MFERPAVRQAWGLPITDGELYSPPPWAEADMLERPAWRQAWGVRALPLVADIFERPSVTAWGFRP